uniref:HlyD family secretion protein n=1 Tax=Acaryochloris sp. IP29b_bin.137 TaxID=2969217 RepID=UPI002623A171
MVSSQIPTPETRQPSKHYSSWHRLRWGVLVLMLMLGPGRIGVQFLISSRTAFSTQPLTQSVERKTLPVTITANGTVYAARSINLSPKSAGVIEQLLVQEGDRVRQGQLVANMDDSNLRGQLTQMQGQLAQQEANLQRLLAGNRREDIAKAKAQLTEARAQLQQLQTGSRPQEVAQAEARLQQAQATLKLRETDWQRYQQLYQAGAVSRESRDQKRTDRDVTKNQVREAEQALALQQAGPRAEEVTQAGARDTQQEQTLAVLQAGNRTEDIAQARAQVLSAQGSLATIQSQLWDAKILAPFDGVVTQIYADVGAFVSPSMAGSGISA